MPPSATFYPVKRTLLFGHCFRRLLFHLCMLVASGLDSAPEDTRGHYSLWGAKLGQAGRTGILHDWPSAPELLTRSDKSFHSGLDAYAARYRSQPAER